MKRIFSAVLLLAMLCSCVACAGDPGASTTESSSATSATFSTSATIATSATAGTSASASQSQSEPDASQSQSQSQSSSSSSGVQEPQGGEPSNTGRDKSKTYRIMFVGNSYTFQSDMPEQLFAAVCRAAGYTVEVDRFANGSHFLWKHSNALHTTIAGTQQVTGKQLDDALKTKKYDFVVIQEQGWTPMQNVETFYAGARIMAEKVKANGAELYMYQTWGYKDGCTAFASGHGGLPENYKIGEMRVRAAYTAIAEEIGAKLCYAGAAFTDVHTNYGANINLYDPDKYHPSIAGSALAAYTIFSNIFGEDVREVNCDLLTNESVTADEQSLTNHVVLTGITHDAANAILKEAAYIAAFVDHDVDPQFKMVSKGVGYTPTVDITKTENLTALPNTNVLSVAGTNGNLSYALTDYTAKNTLTTHQKTHLADTAFGVSVIGVKSLVSANDVSCIADGIWGSSADGSAAKMTFDEHKYTIGGTRSADGEFTALITLNFGEVCAFDAIGYIRGGNLDGPLGFAQAQKVYVSDDGIHWTLVESASYDAVRMASEGQKLHNTTGNLPDSNSAKGNNYFFDMNGVRGQYIRVGIILGMEQEAAANLMEGTGIYTACWAEEQTVNFRELAVLGTKN